MNKEFRCKSNYTLSTKIRNAQSLILSGAQGVGVTTYKLSGTAARASLLQVLSIEATATGSVSQIRIAGQNLNTSDQDGHVGAFSIKASNAGAKQRFIGIAVASQQASTIAVEGTLSAAGDINFGLSLHPISDSQVPSIEAQAEFFNYFCGLGQVAVPAGGTAKLSCVTTRGSNLGQLILSSDVIATTDLTVTSCEINGLEMLGGNSDQAVPFGQFGADAGDVLGNLLHTRVEANANISITVANKNAAIALVRGTIFCD